MAFRLRSGKIRTRRFYVRLYIIFSSTTFLVSSLFMWGFYFNARDDLIESERRLSSDLLTQVSYNLLTIDEMNRNLCFSVLGSNEAQGLLYTTQEDNYALMLMRNRLADSLNSNPFIHSVYLYNRSRDVYYSTFRSFHYVDDDFLRSVESGALRPNLKPLARNLDGRVVLTYGLGELFGRATKDVAIYVNVHLDFLMDNLETFSNGRLLVFDENQNLLNRFAMWEDVSDELLSELREALPACVGAEEAVLQPLSIAGEPDQIATMLHSPGIGWTMVKLQPYGDVFPRTQRLRTTILSLNLLILLVIAVLYAWISRRVYRPIQRMVHQVSGGAAAVADEDEFAYMTRFYREMRQELAALRRSRENKMLLTDLSAQKLLLGSSAMSVPDMEEIVHEYALPIDIRRTMLLLLFLADDYAQLPAEFAGDADRALVTFGIRNILEDCFRPDAPFLLISPANATLALLLNAGAEDTDRLLRRSKAFQVEILQTFHLPVAVAVSLPITEPTALSDAYAATQRRLEDRFIFGKDAVLIPAGQAAENAPDLSEPIQRLKGAIQAGQAPEAVAAAGRFFDLCAKLSAAESVTQIIRLQQALHDAFVIYNKDQKDPVDCSELLRDIESIKADTLSAYRSQVLSAIDSMRRGDANAPTKAEGLANGMLAVIAREYGDSTLCAAAIAERLGLSSAYAGRVFNQYVGMSIPEYINQLRLKKAAAWLSSSDLTVVEIMQRVGYTNESYFFKLFKARYGVTPRNYKG